MGAPRSVIVAGALVVAAAAPRLDQELIQRAAAAVTPPSSLELATVSRATAMVVSNDNQRPAGRLRRHTLELRLVAQETEWRPDLEAPPVPIYALAEEGKAPTIPGPLLRVRAGTRVRVQVRNALAVPMLMRGLQDRPVEALDSVLIARGATHEFTFRASTPGTYYYWGQTAPDRSRFSQGIDGQLLGAFIVDPAEGPVPADRIWVMGAWQQDSGHAHGKNHVMQSMAGLVVGIVVEPRPGQPVMAEEPAARRKLRVFVTERQNVFGPRPGYSYVLQEGAQEPSTDSLRVPSSPIFLTRGEPTEVTVINRSKRSASVHWHGIELESFYDGVGDWSGYGSRTAPPIAPGDSFVVRLTPDRAGTFIYHTHSEEGPLLVSGLYGSLIILEPGEQYEPETDRVFLLGNGGPLPNAPSVVNGRSEVAPLALRIGTTYRLRFINITPNDSRVVRLMADTATLMRWTLFAKDGATLPAHQATERVSRVVLGPGETYDFEFTPRDTTALTLEIFSGARRTRIAVSAMQ